MVQFSVFVENKVGQLANLVRTMDAAGINVMGLAIYDTADWAIDRLIVDDPGRTREAFERAGLTFSECPVMVVEMSAVTDFKNVIASLLQGECNIHYIYSLMSQPDGRPCVVVKVDEEECARDVLAKAGLRVLSQHDISR